jgi:TRAP-type C4-dicarboxylate transport system substrate-binding protein
VPRIAVPALLAAAVLVAGGGVPEARGQQKQIRIATLAPRSCTLGKELKRLDKALRKQSGGGVKLRVYPSGVAGDEKDAIQKIREGQMEGAVLTAAGLSRIVPEIGVIDTPGIITSHQQLEAVLAKLGPEWEKKLLAKGFATVAWSEGGRYRIFSNKPVAGPEDLKNARTWLWAASVPLKELWQAVGARPKALGAPGVYGELQAGKLDALVATALTARTMQWHGKLDHVTGQTFGTLVGALVMERKAWAGLPEAAREVIKRAVAGSALNDRSGMRRADDKAFQELLEQDYKVTAETPESRRQWNQVLQLVRKQLAGAAFPASLLARIEGMAAR